MHKSILASAGFLFLACSTATSSVTPAPPDVSDIDLDTPSEHGAYLWKVEANNAPTGQPPNYLFGTIHVGIPSHGIKPQVWDALRQSQSFTMEADLSALNPLNILEMARLPQDQSLDVLLGKDDWQALLKMSAMPETSLKALKPWFVQLQLLQELIKKYYPASVQMDLSLLEQAKRQGKPVRYLEDAIWQIQLLAQLITIENLRDTIQKPEQFRTEMKNLIESYSAGNISLLQSAVLESEEMRRQPELKQRLLIERNLTWVKTLAESFKSGGNFVAVGVGHLVGEKGLLQLLSEQGFVLTRLAHPSSK